MVVMLVDVLDDMAWWKLGYWKVWPGDPPLLSLCFLASVRREAALYYMLLAVILCLTRGLQTKETTEYRMQSLEQ